MSPLTRLKLWLCGRPSSERVIRAERVELEKATENLSKAVDDARVSVQNACTLLDIMDEIVARVRQSSDRSDSIH